MNNFINRLNIFRKTRKELKNKTVELKKFRLALDQAPAAIYIINNDMVFEYANPEFTRQSGYTQADVIGKHVIDSIYKGEIPENRRAIVEALGKGTTWQGELHSRHKTGRMYWANTIASPYTNDSGDVDGYIVIQQDITEHKRIEEALKESEDLYRNLIENSLEGMALTQDGKMLFVNQSFVDMIGYTLDELIAMEPSVILAPEDRERVLENHYKRMRGELGNYTYNSDFIRKDGTRFTAEMNSAKVQINGKNASLITMHDITERLKIQQTLRESESKYKALVENSQDGISIVRDNKYLFVNQTFCNMLGYTPEELYEIPAVMTIYPDDRPKAMEQADRRRNHDFSTINVIYRMLTKSGEMRECETTSTLVEFGGIWASFFTSHDITENKRIQIELKESEEKYRQLVESTNSIILKWDRNFNITFLNEFGLSLFGFTRDEIIDKPMVGTIVPHSEEVSGRNLQMLMDDIFKNPEKYSNNINENICKNGKRIWVSWNNTAVKDENNNTISMFSVGTDITENVRIQNELNESEEKYRSLIENVNDGIIITQSGDFKFVNQAFCDMLQYSSEELIDSPYINTVHPDYKELMLSYHNRRMRGEDFKAIYRSQLIRKDSKIITVEINARTSEINGKPSGFIITRDITERLKIEEELQIAKENLETLNSDLEQRIIESSENLAETRTQLINLQKENLQSQFEVLRQQVNPHFLFNSLNVLTSLIKLEPDLAEQFSEHLSKVYRYVLENKDNEMVDLNTELRFLDAYIFLLNIRFIDKIKVNIDIPNEKRSYLIIPLAMQLLIENAIKHNIMTKSDPLRIEIFIDDNNFLNVINNLQERPSQLVSTGVGLKNIENRYLLLNNTKPFFEKTETQFVAKVPLVNS